VLFSYDPARGRIVKADVITDLFGSRQFIILFPRKDTAMNLKIATFEPVFNTPYGGKHKSFKEPPIAGGSLSVRFTTDNEL
jgi:hypothetical protein